MGAFIKSIRYSILFFLFLLTTLATYSPASLANGINVAHLYKLSNFTGIIPYSEVRIHADRKNDEVYVINGNFVQVFNEAGMEVYRFGDDPALGNVRDLAVDAAGNIILLSYDLSHAAGSVPPAYFLLRCNYRGEPREKIEVKDLPPKFSRLMPQIVFYREGSILLVSKAQMLAVEIDGKGTFRKGYELADLIGIPEEDRPNTEIFGFNVDGRGNMLFTVPVLFTAFRVSPDGLVTPFGKKGSSPGTFGIASGVAADERGNILVSDSLRNVIMVFDEKFRFVMEFGTYGFKPQNLVRPRDLAMGKSGKLYVVQLRKQGVSVFSVNPN